MEKVEDDLKKVEEDVKKVEAHILKVEEEMKDCSDIDERKYVRKEKEQLREQLRDDVKFLRERQPVGIYLISL